VPGATQWIKTLTTLTTTCTVVIAPKLTLAKIARERKTFARSSDSLAGTMPRAHPSTQDSLTSAIARPGIAVKTVKRTSTTALRGPASTGEGAETSSMISNASVRGRVTAEASARLTLTSVVEVLVRARWRVVRVASTTTVLTSAGATQTTWAKPGAENIATRRTHVD